MQLFQQELLKAGVGEEQIININLENHYYDNIPQLIDFYKECKDITIKEELKTYFNNMIMK